MKNRCETFISQGFTFVTFFTTIKVSTQCEGENIMPAISPRAQLVLRWIAAVLSIILSYVFLNLWPVSLIFTVLGVMFVLIAAHFIVTAMDEKKKFAIQGVLGEK